MAASIRGGLRPGAVTRRQGRGVVPRHPGGRVEAAHLPDELRQLSVRAFRPKEGRVPTLEEQERDYILWVLEEAN
ncbi:MAG: hypothetical protein EP309_03225, partial [Gammaproteobacteria bacterium]